MKEKNQIAWTETAQKQLLKIDRRYIQKIIDKVDELESFPYVRLDIKDLKGKANQYRLRVGAYRVLFEVIDGVPKIVEIQAIKRRSDRTYS